MNSTIARYFLKVTSVLFLTFTLAACGSGSKDEPEKKIEVAFKTKSSLGESLFSDQNLSMNRNQSCATCHNPEHGFIDNRRNAIGEISAVSLGDDDISLGDRNTPTASYAKFSPDFHIGTKQRFNSQQPDYDGALGGQFLDGREIDLTGQAGKPLTNPIEMAMPDNASVIDRIKENSDYVASFEFIFGSTIFDNLDNAFLALTESLSEFEKTSQFSPFDSKYDRFIKGEYVYDPLSKSAAGKALFFSQQFTNCATCHQLHPNGHAKEIFSSFEYHNIGVPINEQVRLDNNKPAGFIDNGLLDNPAIDDITEKGKFKTPTLRNIAVTGPYMHNGIFKNLKTVIEFYDHFLTNSEHMTNPETGLAWASAEIEETIALTELRDGRKLSDADVEALVCFLHTLTDARYENLIVDDGIDCEN